MALCFGLEACAPEPDPTFLCEGEGRQTGWFDDPRHQALVRCIDRGYTEEALRLVEAGVATPPVKDWALSRASVAGNVDVARALLAVGADPNGSGGFEGADHLANAAGQGHVAMVGLLLEAGADLNAAPEGEFSGGPPIRSAAWKGHVAVVKQLLEHGADPNVGNDYDGWTALWEVACRPPDEGVRYEILELLVAHGADLEARDAGGFNGWTRSGRTPLACAVEAGDAKLAQHLIDLGADVNGLIHGGSTILEVARRKGIEAMALLLEEAGATTERELASPGDVYRALELAGIAQARSYWMQSTRLEKDLDGDGVRELVIILVNPGGPTPPRVLAVIGRRGGDFEALFAREEPRRQQMKLENAPDGVRVLVVEPGTGAPLQRRFDLRWDAPGRRIVAHDAVPG